MSLRWVDGSKSSFLAISEEPALNVLIEITSYNSWQWKLFGIDPSQPIEAGFSESREFAKDASLQMATAKVKNILEKIDGLKSNERLPTPST